MVFKVSKLFGARLVRLSVIAAAGIGVLTLSLVVSNGSATNAEAAGTSSTANGGASLCYGEVAITQENADTATIIDQNTDLVTHTIGVVATPYPTTFSGDGRLLFVGGVGISVIDTSTNTVIQTLPIGGLHVGYLVTNFDGSLIYAVVSDNSTESVIAITRATGTTVASYPVAFGHQGFGVLLSTDGSTLWYIDATSLTFSAIELNASTLALVSSTAIPAYSFQFALHGNTIYFGSLIGNGVVTMNTQTHVLVPVGPTGIVWAIAISPDGNTMYSINGQSAQLIVTNLTTNTSTSGLQLNTVAPQELIPGMAITADGSKLYVMASNYAEGGLIAIATASPNAGTFIPMEIYATASTCPLASDPASIVTTTTAAADPVAPSFTG
jgi:DNA-binding beta-propeller fold protein YncE